MKIEEINSRKFRGLSRVPESSTAREILLNGTLVCRIFLAGKEVARSVTRWVSGSKEVKYFLLT